MYWIEITGKNGIIARLGNCSEIELTSLLPLLADTGLEAKFGDVGSHKVKGGCLGRASVLNEQQESDSQQN